MKKTKLPLILLGILLVVGALALVLTFVISPATHEDTPTSQTTVAPTPDSTTSTAVSTTPLPPVTMSEAEKQAAIAKLEQLQSEYGALHSFPYLESLIAGNTPLLTTRLTLDQVRQFVAESDNLDAIWEKIRAIQPCQDETYGSGIVRHTYWLDEEGTEYIAIGKRVGIEYVKTDGDNVVTEQLFPKDDPA